MSGVSQCSDLLSYSAALAQELFLALAAEKALGRKLTQGLYLFAQRMVVLR